MAFIDKNQLKNNSTDLKSQKNNNQLEDAKILKFKDNPEVPKSHNRSYSNHDNNILADSFKNKVKKEADSSRKRSVSMNFTNEDILKANILNIKGGGNARKSMIVKLDDSDESDDLDEVEPPKNNTQPLSHSLSSFSAIPKASPVDSKFHVDINVSLQQRLLELRSNLAQLEDKNKEYESELQLFKNSVAITKIFELKDLLEEATASPNPFPKSLPNSLSRSSQRKGSLLSHSKPLSPSFYRPPGFKSNSIKSLTSPDKHNSNSLEENSLQPSIPMQVLLMELQNVSDMGKKLLNQVNDLKSKNEQEISKRSDTQAKISRMEDKLHQIALLEEQLRRANEELWKECQQNEKHQGEKRDLEIELKSVQNQYKQQKAKLEANFLEIERLRLEIQNQKDIASEQQIKSENDMNNYRKSMASLAREGKVHQEKIRSLEREIGALQQSRLTTKSRDSLQSAPPISQKQSLSSLSQDTVNAPKIEVGLEILKMPSMNFLSESLKEQNNELTNSLQLVEATKKRYKKKIQEQHKLLQRFQTKIHKLMDKVSDDVDSEADEEDLLWDFSKNPTLSQISDSDIETNLLKPPSANTASFKMGLHTISSADEESNENSNFLENEAAKTSNYSNDDTRGFEPPQSRLRASRKNRSSKTPPRVPSHSNLNKSIDLGFLGKNSIINRNRSRRQVFYSTDDSSDGSNIPEHNTLSLQLKNASQGDIKTHDEDVTETKVVNYASLLINCISQSNPLMSDDLISKIDKKLENEALPDLSKAQISEFIRTIFKSQETAQSDNQSNQDSYKPLDTATHLSTDSNIRKINTSKNVSDSKLGILQMEPLDQHILSSDVAGSELTSKPHVFLSNLNTDSTPASCLGVSLTPFSENADGGTYYSILDSNQTDKDASFAVLSDNPHMFNSSALTSVVTDSVSPNEASNIRNKENQDDSSLKEASYLFSQYNSKNPNPVQEEVYSHTNQTNNDQPKEIISNITKSSSNKFLEPPDLDRDNLSNLQLPLDQKEITFKLSPKTTLSDFHTEKPLEHRGSRTKIDNNIDLVSHVEGLISLNTEEARSQINRLVHILQIQAPFFDATESNFVSDWGFVEPRNGSPLAGPITTFYRYEDTLPSAVPLPFPVVPSSSLRPSPEEYRYNISPIGSLETTFISHYPNDGHKDNLSGNNNVPFKLETNKNNKISLNELKSAASNEVIKSSYLETPNENASLLFNEINGVYSEKTDIKNSSIISKYPASLDRNENNMSKSINDEYSIPLAYLKSKSFSVHDLSTNQPIPQYPQLFTSLIEPHQTPNGLLLKSPLAFSYALEWVHTIEQKALELDNGDDSPAQKELNIALGQIRSFLQQCTNNHKENDPVEPILHHGSKPLVASLKEECVSSPSITVKEESKEQCKKDDLSFKDSEPLIKEKTETKQEIASPQLKPPKSPHESVGAQLASAIQRIASRGSSKNTSSSFSHRENSHSNSRQNEDNYKLGSASVGRNTNKSVLLNDYYQMPDNTPFTHSTDDAVVLGITQAMSGEYLYKFVRSTTFSTEPVHRRFFWLNPYTRVLAWARREPEYGLGKRSPRQVYVRSVEEVHDEYSHSSMRDENNKAILVHTNTSQIRIKADSSTRHELWFTALSYVQHHMSDEYSKDSRERLWKTQKPRSVFLNRAESSQPINPTSSYSSGTQPDISEGPSHTRAYNITKSSTNDSLNTPSSSTPAKEFIATQLSKVRSLTKTSSDHISGKVNHNRSRSSSPGLH